MELSLSAEAAGNLTTALSHAFNAVGKYCGVVIASCVFISVVGKLLYCLLLICCLLKMAA